MNDSEVNIAESQSSDITSMANVENQVKITEENASQKMNETRVIKISVNSRVRYA